MSNQRHGGRLLADQLNIHGCTRVFQVPGESYLPVLDGLYDHPHIDVITCRQEGGAAMMAEADGKLTGQPGVCLVTRAPGASNAAAGVHIAKHDSTPMLLLVGHVEREHIGRDAFQEVDLVAMFTPLAKWAVQINDVDRIPETIRRAWQVAISGRPGPVVVALPEDMLFDQSPAPDAPAAVAPAQPVDPADVESAMTLLAKAHRPLVIAGGGRWSAATSAALAQAAERYDLPVISSFRRQDYLSNEHSNYVGTLSVANDPALAERVEHADFVLALGTRLGEVVTDGYRLIEAPTPRQTLVHVHPEQGELGKVIAPALAVHASVEDFLAGAVQLDAPASIAWRDWRRQARDDFLAFSQPAPMPGSCHTGEIIRQLNELAPDAFVANGAGNYTAWVHRHTNYRQFPCQLAATSGSMGYGVPAAIAAKLRFPARASIAWAGDGCFMMHGQELATAVQHEANIVIIVVNNGMYGTIRMHQQKHFKGRVVGTELRNPDFVALARSYGAFGARVAATGEFEAAWHAAVNSGKPALIELVVSPEASTPNRTLTEISAA